MFVVVLEFKVERSEIAPLMPAHSQWLQRGFDDGVFALTGSISPGSVTPGGGGMILAHHLTRDELRARLDQDPLVAEGKVSVAISEVKPSRVDERMNFLAE